MNNRQRCFDYLLDNMQEPERKRFSIQLNLDQTLVLELRKCEEDLASFAEASSMEMSPPAYVWDNILEATGLSKSPVQEAAQEPARVPARSYWRYLWPVAACLLLTLNIAQWYRGGLSEPANNGAALEMVASPEYARQGESYRQMRREIVELRAKLAQLDTNLERADDEDHNRVIAELDALKDERDVLFDRIEVLETNYLALVEVAEPILEDLSKLVVNGVAELVKRRGRLGAPASAGIWNKLANMKSDGKITVLSSGSRSGSGMGGFVITGPDGNPLPPEEGEVVELEPYALAFVDTETGQAVVSLGNIPTTEPEETLVVWATNEETAEVVPVGELPRSLQGTSSDIGFQLPAGYAMAGSEFLVSIEATGYEALDVPSARTVVDTFSASSVSP